MGTLDLLTKHLKEMTLRNGSRFLVIASEQHTESLIASPSKVPGLQVVTMACGEPVVRDLLRDASLVVIEIEPDDRASLQRIVDIRASLPDVPLVAAINGASVSLVRTLVREGITDVVALPFDIDELMQVALDATARHNASAPEQALAPLVAIARSIGGCGATSIATHLAADLAANSPGGKGTVIADLDLQFGSVADYLGVRAHGHLGDLLDAQDRLDEDLLRSVAGDAGYGVAVVAAPDKIMPLESIDTDAVLRVLRLLREQYDYVVLDLPTNWTDWTLSAANAAGAIILVVELSVVSLTQAKRSLELFRSVGIDDRAIQIVVNRVEKRLFRAIDLDDVAKALNHPVLDSVSLDSPVVSNAQNQASFVGAIQRKSRFVTDIARLGERLRAGPLARNRA